jgi:hypothetical protein
MKINTYFELEQLDKIDLSQFDTPYYQPTTKIVEYLEDACKINLENGFLVSSNHWNVFICDCYNVPLAVIHVNSR